MSKGWWMKKIMIPVIETKDVIKSHGKWTKIENSSDTHQTVDEAKGICWRLLNDYGEHTRGCETRGHCLESWTTVNDIKVGENRYDKAIQY